MSNAPIPPSPGPSRPRPGYGGYQPPHGNSFYANVVPNSDRFRGDSRRVQPSYRPREHHPDHYETAYDGDKHRFGWRMNHSHPQGYDTSPGPWPRREVMAERMFEPSESWKHDHVPDSGLDISERFASSRMPPPREDYMYPYGGDSYRTGPTYIPRRDSVHSRQPGPYRSGYFEEGHWNYPLDDTSNSWNHRRSPSNTSRPPRGRVDYRDVSYERSLSGSRSSRFSSPRHSRATASRRAPSPSSSSIRSSRERSKSLPRSREHSRSSERSSVDSCSYTGDPPVRPQVHPSHPVGQFRGQRRGGMRSGMRFPVDGFRDSVAPPFVQPMTYPNEMRPDDHIGVHPSLPLRPSSPYLTPGPGGRNHISERGLSGPAQSSYHDPQAGRGSSFNVSANQQAYQLGRSKRKRRGGINRKKRNSFPYQARDALSDSNTTLLPLDSPDEYVVHAPSPEDDDPTSKGLYMSAVSEPQAVTSAVAEEAPTFTEIEPSSAVVKEFPPYGTLKLEEDLPSPKVEVSTPVMVDTSRPGDTGELSSLVDGDKNESSPMTEVVPELPRLVIPTSEFPAEAPSTQDGPNEVIKTDSPCLSQSALFSPVPVASTATPLPQSEPALERCSSPQLLSINGLPEATTCSPVSSVAPTPSLQTPSPPYVAPGVIVAAPVVQEPEDIPMPASPVSSALQAVGVPAIVRSDHDTFSMYTKEAKSLTEALRIVVSARQKLELQSREERVNPILMSNRVSAPSTDIPVPSANALVQEVLAGHRAKGTIQAFESHVRDSLVANMAARQETVDEKAVQLRRDYLALHREWIARCAEMDNLHRVDPAAGEVSSLPARTTRRSAAVLGDAVRSDLEMEQIIASLGNDELYDPAHLALRNLAAIPDMISVSRGKVDAVFDDTNNAVHDPLFFFDPSPGLAEWTDDEVEIYKQRFAKYPKQFGHIAAGLAHKTQAQCVQFYYLHKKVLIDFREAIATYGQSKRRRGGRRTDKKKGGLLADIRQHDAEVSKGQDPVKRRAGAARRRRESARTAPRRSITAVLQEEQTPVTTPTPEPEPEPVRPKRRRNARPVPEPEPAGTEDPPPKRSRRTRKPKPAPDTPTEEPKPLSKPPPINVPNANPSIQEIVELLAQYGRGIAASLPNKTNTQAGNSHASNLERCDLNTVMAQAPGRSPTADSSQDDKKDPSELIRDIANANHERPFAVNDVPPISATSRSHLLDLQSCSFSIPGSTSGSTLPLYS